MADDQRRSTDPGNAWLLILKAFRGFWDFIDNRDIDKHTVSIAVMLGTWDLTRWAMNYAQIQHAKSGVEVAAIIAAVTGPYMALQAAAIAFYFRARSS